MVNSVVVIVAIFKFSIHFVHRNLELRSLRYAHVVLRIPRETPLKVQDNAVNSTFGRVSAFFPVSVSLKYVTRLICVEPVNQVSFSGLHSFTFKILLPRAKYSRGLHFYRAEINFVVTIISNEFRLTGLLMGCL